MPEKLTLENLRSVFLKLLAPAIVGVLLFEGCARLLFGISLWHGASESWAPPMPMSWCAIVMYLSVIVGSWSVGGGLCHVLGLVGNWLSLYSAGGK
jgi:hypothetical protein